MSNSELVDYRISRAKETLEEAILLAKANHWNAVANRLYYSIFYMVNALLILNDINYDSHNGVKTEFHKLYVKEGKVSMESGKLYSRLFNLRQESDYADFKRFEKNEILPFIDEVKSFLEEVGKLINKY